MAASTTPTVPSQTPEDVLVKMNVSSGTNVKNLAISISRAIQRGKTVRLTAIGPPAVCQMMKGAAKSAGFLAPTGKDVLWRTYFTDCVVKMRRPFSSDPEEDLLGDSSLKDASADPPGTEVQSGIVIESRLA